MLATCVCVLWYIMTTVGHWMLFVVLVRVCKSFLCSQVFITIAKSSVLPIRSRLSVHISSSLLSVVPLPSHL